MPLQVYRLRRLLAAMAVLLTAIVAGMYFYARSKATDVLKSIPNKMGIDIKQTANGFQVSKSDGKRTLFTVQASSVKQFKFNGNAELHNVNIILYGRDSSRFDQIYGENFAYNQKTGDVTAMGEVQIDLVANPAGLASPDQATPKEIKNPIHLKTRDLVFNKDTGNAFTHARVEVVTPQASGWAMGVTYASKTQMLTLESQIHLSLTGPQSADVEAQSGAITNEPRQIVLDHPHLVREDGSLSADRATFHLDQDNHVERVFAEGNVTAHTLRRTSNSSASKLRRRASSTREQINARADQAEFLFVPDQDLLRTATLSGKVHLEQVGAEPMIADAGRVNLEFAGNTKLQKVQASAGAHLKQIASGAPGKANATAQDLDLTAPIIDFNVTDGHILRHANTSGPAQITIVQGQASDANVASSPQQTVVTAGRFDADFTTEDGRTRLTRVHGAPNANIRNSSPGQPDRVSTSDTVEASFVQQGGLGVLTQAGNVHYSQSDGQNTQLQGWANSARYTPSDQMLALSGNPRVQQGGMVTTATRMRINRMNGEALAEGAVKSTYSELKEQPSGALLAASSPIHVTADRMTAHSSPAGIALYSGNARLWQDANMVEAPAIQFDRDHRALLAQGTAQQPVKTTLLQADKAQAGGNRSKKGSGASPAMPISITGLRLTYTDSERKVHYEGNVVAKAAEFTASATTVDAYLLSRSQAASNQNVAAPGQLDRMVAQGNVVIQQPNRRAEGQNLVYTVSEDKFVLTGGPPSIFDAEQGKITGVSLTFFRRDDRVLVEGEASNPVVTQTRVAR